MVRIRLALGGSKKSPFYYVVVTDGRNSRDGNFIERIGFFNPVKFSVNKELYMNFDKVQYWLNKGAKPSGRVVSLMKKLNFFKNKVDM